MIKNLILAFVVLSLASPAYAATRTAQEEFTHYRKWRYWPIQVICFIVAGPVIIVSNMVQHRSDQLEASAEAEIKQ